MAAPIISAVAALAGVCLAQLIGSLQRRHDERQRRQDQMAGVIALTLSLILDAMEQIEQARVSQMAWRRQTAWIKLRDESWPLVRTGLLTQAAQQPRDSEPSIYGVALTLQRLLIAWDEEPAIALDAWAKVLTDVESLQHRRLT